MIATHLGIVDEDQINNMSFLFFEDVLKELGHKLSYDAIVNYAGNSFCKDSWDMITKNNPLHVGGDTRSQAMTALSNFLGSAHMKVIKKEK